MQHSTEQEEKRRYPFPLIGNRILKTALAVFICLMIHMLCGFRGGVAESCITAIVCMQPYSKDARKSAVSRLLSTSLGGFWGLVFLIFVMHLPQILQNMFLIYIFVALGVIVAVYSCVVLNISDSAALCAIVFLCLVVKYPAVDPSLSDTLFSILDTVIGVLVALTVNSIRIPTEKQPDHLYFLRLRDLAADRYATIDSRVLIELNRLYDEGARICLETEWAPAFMIGQLQQLHVNLPVIVLGGAALYDIRENMYTEVCDMPHEDADYLYDYLNSMELCGCVFALRGNSMLISHTGEKSQLEEENYRLMRRSPYRNYVDGKYQQEDRILAFRVIVGPTKALELEARFNGNLTLAEHFHVVKYPRPLHPGQVLFYFFRKDVSIQAMEERMITELIADGKEKVVPIRIRPKSRVFDPERDAPTLLHRLRKSYMPSRLFRKRKK